MAKKFDNANKVDKLLSNYSAPAENNNSRAETTVGKRKYTTVGGIKRAYYITPEQDRAITMKSAVEGMTKNEVIQEALNSYLEDYLK